MKITPTLDYLGYSEPATRCPVQDTEDLNHSGAHKINNVLGQALLAKKMGKTRLIAETGAGQHGVATAAPEHIGAYVKSMKDALR